MSTDSPAPPPRVLAAEVEALRADLTDARFTSSRSEELLGPVAAQALRRENPAPARRILARLEDPAATLLDLFTLGARIPRAQVEAALPALGVEGAQRLGLLEADGEGPDSPVRALWELAPYSAQDDLGEIEWWIASDLSELATDAPLGPEHVLGVGGASLTLARITPRERVGSVLDLGCGGGIQALHASRHAERVVATDLSERALGVAAVNAALNGIDLELRQGSLLEPVAGERFDLIVSNPPFVITPRTLEDADTTWTYRDGGRAGDALLEELLQSLPAHLAPGGTAVTLGNWEIREGGITSRDPRWPALMSAWLDDFAGRAIAGIGFGYLLLRRPLGNAGRPGVLRTEEVPATGSGTLSVHLAQSLQMLDALESLDDAALSASRPVRADDVVERRHLTPGQWDPMLIELVQGAGFARSVPADQLLAATVGALDGTLTLGQVLAAVCALTDADPDEAGARLLPAVRELAITGMVTL